MYQTAANALPKGEPTGVLDVHPQDLRLPTLATRTTLNSLIDVVRTSAVSNAAIIDAVRTITSQRSENVGGQLLQPRNTVCVPVLGFGILG